MKKLFSVMMTMLMAVVMPFSAFAQQAQETTNGAKLSDTLTILGQGMLGIFVVMVLIYIVIVVLNKVTKDKK